MTVSDYEWRTEHAKAGDSMLEGANHQSAAANLVQAALCLIVVYLIMRMIDGS